MSTTITVRMPLFVARFLYTVIESFLSGNLATLKTKLTTSQKAAVFDFLDNLAIEISMEGG